MYNIENKKISVVLMLTAVFGIVLCVFLRQDIYKPTTSTTIVEADANMPADYIFIKYLPQQKEYSPIRALYEYKSYYVIDGVVLFGLELKYKALITLFIVLIGVSLYLFLYMTDEQIKNRLSTLKRLTAKSSKHKLESKFFLLFILSLLCFIVIVVFWINYYSSIESLSRPLTWGESFFMGFSKVILIVIALSIITTIIKSVLTKKE